MDTSRNDLLGELAADAALERTDFLASASAQLGRFLDGNEARLRELGGVVLIDDEVGRSEITDLDLALVHLLGGTAGLRRLERREVRVEL